MIRKLTLAAALLAPAALAAQDLPTAPYLPLELATKAAQTTLEACAADGYNVSVAIVSRDGATKVHLKADGSGPHTVGSAQGKAFTSASMGRDTAGLAKFIGENPQHDGLRYMDDRMVIQGGGLPIKIGGALVGGIGVGGAPGGHLDEACARVGLDAIGAE
ncbi:heme-binding protein [uncultured Aliiroseovarius sp.]|uniref:GlcG/HbpS family heme-binding protein n=1 Tax=uncultured Aliiroseovarius sp. TaxID=1658783 RepID=UPI00260F8BE9|nr:heme-binding protein [uncultured Aliiroseovarius sp.]